MRKNREAKCHDLQTGSVHEFVLFLLPLGRDGEMTFGATREDYNIDTTRKRFKVFLKSSLLVIEYYNSKGKVRKIDAAKPVGEVFSSSQGSFHPSG
ncbi:putative UMP/CMP kinase [Helianthus debilis subsp. tardiflorus]